jgi:DNA-binding MurR/RpiR family transcriptional regulator
MEVLMVEELDGFRRRLEEHLPDLSKSQQRIASYLLTSYDEAAFLSAADLAQRLQVSQATVVRFAKAIGYAGFPELKRCLQDLYRGQVTPAAHLQHKLAELASHQGHVLTKVIDMEVQYLTEAAHSVSLAEFDRAVEIILNAHRIFVRGGGPSAVLADLLELRFRRMGILTFSMTDSARDLIEKLQLLQPEDAVIATGFHRLSSELAAVVEHAHSVGCPIILITDTLGAAFHGKVDVVLAARRGPVSTFHSLNVPMAIVNALILAVAMARPDESLAALDRMQRMRAAYGFGMPGKVSP